MLKISKQELSEFWKSVENVKVINPETKNEVKLKSLKPEEFQSHKKILKQYWDQWEKSKKEDITPKVSETKKIGQGFSFPVDHGKLNELNIPPEQKEDMKKQVLKGGIFIEGIGEEGLKGEAEKEWVSKQLGIPKDQIKVTAYDDVLVETYPEKEVLAYATFSNPDHFKNDKRFNPKKPKEYLKSLLKDKTQSYQGYEFKDDEIDKYIDLIEKTDSDVLKPGKFKDSGDLYNAIYYLTFDGPGEQNDDGTNKNLLGNKVTELLKARRQNLINLQKKSGGVSFIGSGHFDAIKARVDEEDDLTMSEFFKDKTFTYTDKKGNKKETNFKGLLNLYKKDKDNESIKKVYESAKKEYKSIKKGSLLYKAIKYAYLNKSERPKILEDILKVII